MPINDPFPIDISEKQNSPELIAFFQQFGRNWYLSAEEINLIKRALDYLRENIGAGSGGGVQSVTGTNVDASDPENPIIDIPSLQDVANVSRLIDYLIFNLDPNQQQQVITFANYFFIDNKSIFWDGGAVQGGDDRQGVRLPYTGNGPTPTLEVQRIIKNSSSGSYSIIASDSSVLLRFIGSCTISIDATANGLINGEYHLCKANTNSNQVVISPTGGITINGSTSSLTIPNNRRIVLKRIAVNQFEAYHADVVSVETASDTVSGIMRLYQVLGQNTNGAISQKAATDALNLKIQQQLIASSINSSINANTTNFAFFIAGGANVFNATELNRNICLGAAFRATRLIVTLANSQPVSGSLLVEIRVNNATVGATTRTIAAGSPAGIYTLDFDITVGANDLVCYRAVNNATSNSANIAGIACVIIPII